MKLCNGTTTIDVWLTLTDIIDLHSFLTRKNYTDDDFDEDDDVSDEDDNNDDEDASNDDDDHGHDDDESHKSIYYF